MVRHAFAPDEVIQEFDRHAEVLRGARAQSTDEAVSGLLAPLVDWLARLPNPQTPELSAGLLL